MKRFICVLVLCCSVFGLFAEGSLENQKENENQIFVEETEKSESSTWFDFWYYYSNFKKDIKEDADKTPLATLLTLFFFLFIGLVVSILLMKTAINIQISFFKVIFIFLTIVAFIAVIIWFTFCCAAIKVAFINHFGELICFVILGIIISGLGSVSFPIWILFL